MDILSIRKKARRADQPIAVSSHQTEGASSSTSDTLIPTEAATALPTDNDGAPLRTEAPAPPPRRSARPESLEPESAAGADDPLQGFLARYDLDDRSEDRSAPLAFHGGSDATRRFLSFRLADEDYAASIMDIREILTIRSLTEVPRAPKEVLGVLSKRGVVLPVIDLATSLGLRAAERRLRAAQRVLVVGDGDRVCGLRVDAISEVIKLQHTQIEAVPASLGQKNAGLLVGLGRVQATLYILLDINAVLDAFAIAMGVTPTPRPEVG